MEPETIDCSGTPKMEFGTWRYDLNDQLPKRVKDSNFVWNKTAQTDSLYVSSKQRKGFMNGDDLKKELQDKEVLPSQVLDWLMENKNQIPSAWKKNEREILFWGSIFYGSDDDTRFVRNLSWAEDQWVDGVTEIIDENFGKECASVIMK